MDQVPKRLGAWWRQLDPQGRRHASILALIGMGYLGHYLVFCIPQPFFIEDSAISFAYARNLVEGEGLVTWWGGERVEGFSNALWTLLVAAWYALGVPVWTSSKVMGAVFGLLTLPFTYAIVLRARPGMRTDVALVAPLMLAASPQFVVWNASGLENSLYCLLLAAGMWRLLVEVEEEDDTRQVFPWSAVCYAGLAMTRPEGVMYAAIAAVCLVLDGIARRRLRPTLVWGLVLAVPLVLYEGWRLWYFAWPLPNTYYAKEADGSLFKLYKWSGTAWKYVQNYFKLHLIIWLVPLLAFGLSSLRHKRRWVPFVVLPWLAFVILWDGRALPGWAPPLPELLDPILERWVEIRVWSIAASAALMGFLTLGFAGWRARGLLWAGACAGVFFALHANGDWMKGHRWFNLTSVTLFPMLVVGLGELVDALPLEGIRFSLPRGPRWLREGLNARLILLLVAAGCWVSSEAWHSNAFAQKPETAVRDVNRRILYMGGVVEKLDLDRVSLLDVDMGAHLYYVPDWRIADIAGLVDVPMARHKGFAKAFIRQYIFEEVNPTFAHVHAGWARTSKIPTHPEWKKRYLEIPGYPAGGLQLHPGNFIRKDLLVEEAGEADGEPVRFAGGIRLVDLQIPSPEVAPGGQLFVDLKMQAAFREEPFQLLIFLDNGAGARTVSAQLPAWGWYPVDDWKSREVIHTRYRVDLPEDLPEGDYQVGLVLVDQERGQVLFPIGDDPDPLDPLKHKKPKGKRGGKKKTDEDADEEADAPPEKPPTMEEIEGKVEPALVEVPEPATPPRYLAGEWLAPQTVHLVSAAAALEAAQADLSAAFDLALDPDRCEEVWPRWKDATRHVLRRSGWQEEHGAQVKAAVGACLVRRASTLEEEPARIAALVEARQWDRHNPELLELARPLAARRSEAGDALRAEEDWAGAYAAYSDALALDPRLSWTRRHAEEVRDLDLGLVKEPSIEEEDGGEREGDDGAEPSDEVVLPVGGEGEEEVGIPDEEGDQPESEIPPPPGGLLQRLRAPAIQGKRPEPAD